MSLGLIFLIITSGILLYFYGHRKYCEWREQQDRIYMRSKPGAVSPTLSVKTVWFTFFPHFLACASLVIIAAAALPLMYDLILIYCNSYDSAPLIGTCGLVLFLLQYILLWLMLTLKQTWNFDSEFKEVSDMPYGMIFHRNPSQNPLGLSDRTARTESGYAASESESKYTIPAFLARSSIRNKAVSSSVLTDKTEDVYWLKNSDQNEQYENTMSRRNSCYIKNTNNKIAAFDEPQEDMPQPPKRTRSKRRQSHAREERTFAPSSDRCQMNGDYELLIENPPMSPYGTVPYEDIYGIRSLFSPTGFTTLHEVSVESDSSSGVHSDASPDNSISGIPRTRSSENLHNEIKRVQNRSTSFRTTSYPRRDLRITNVRNSDALTNNMPVESPRVEVPPPMREIKRHPFEDIYSCVQRPTQMTSFAEAKPQRENFPDPPEDMLCDQLMSSLPTFRNERFRSESEFEIQIQKHFLRH
jgi:hypothetical protein